MELLELLLGGGMSVLGGVAGIIVFFFLVGFAKFLIRVTLPDKLIVVSGRKKKFRTGKKFGFSVERGRSVIWPYFNQVSYLELGILPITVRVEGVNSANGITLGADATACVCIDDDEDALIYSAVERLMGKSREQIHEQIRQTLIGNFRGALNKATPLQAIGMEETIEEDEADEKGPRSAEEEGEALLELKGGGAQTKIQPEIGGRTIVKGERAEFRSDLLQDINADISHFGMKVVSVSLQRIWDNSNYIANLAQKTLSHKRQAVEIQEQRLRARAAQAESDAERRKSVAKSQADEKVLASKQKLEVFRRESEAKIQQAKLEADNAIAESQNKGERDVQEQIVELQKLKNQSQVVMEAQVRQEAAQIIAEGEKGAVNIREQARNHILRQKAELLEQSGDVGKAVLFLQQQLPHLFDAYREHTQRLAVDSFVIMDEHTGFNGAVNRGPAAFVDFLRYLDDGLGISVRELLQSGPASPVPPTPTPKEAAL